MAAASTTSTTGASSSRGASALAEAYLGATLSLAGLAAAVSTGAAVSQWADTASTASGRSSDGPSPARNSCAGLCWSASIGEPCERKRVGCMAGR